MNNKYSSLILLLFISLRLQAQKPFIEGIIVFDVNIESADNTIQSTGTYTYTIKGKQLRKELKMNNGYQDIVICNGNTNMIYSLQAKEDKKYAIEMNAEYLENKQSKYKSFRIINDKEGTKKIAGYTARKGKVEYKDGNSSTFYYSSELYPGDENMFDRFPDIKVMPLSFIYKNDNGMTMNFYAKQILTKPIENSLFRVPPDYKIITYNEYKQMNK
jgi:hypothetical protein